MTISTTSNKTIQAGNAVTTNWPFLFIIPAASQLYVYVTDALGNITTIPAGQYSVAGINNPNGGSVTYPLSGSPLAVGTTITIYRLVPYQQLTDVTNQGGFYPEVYEAALDYLTMEVQQLAEITGRSLVLPLTVSGVSTTLPVPAAGFALGWDPTATFITNLAAAGAVPIPVPVAYGGTGKTTPTLGFAALAAEAISYAGIIAPTQLAANTNDWAPTGFATASIVRASASAAWNLTGIAAGTAGRTFTLHNVGAFTITLKDDVTSTAANRFQLAGDYALGADQSVLLQYDATSSRWRMVGQGTAYTGTAPIVITGAAISLALRDYIAGLGMSPAGGSASMPFAAGIATDSTNAVMMTAAALTKTTGAWAVGTGNGGKLNAAAIATGTWYPWFLIYRPDTGVVDIGFDLAANEANPTLPANYTLWRRIGWGLTDGASQWVKFEWNQDTDEFLWVVPVNDVNAAATATANRTARTLTAAPNCTVVADVYYKTNGTGVNEYCFLSTTNMTDTAAAATNFTMTVSAGTNTEYGNVNARYKLSSSRQMFDRGSAAGLMGYMTRGWIDSRGRNA